MPDIIDDLQWRGLIAQSTDLDALRKALADGPVTLYCGFDPTGPSLHIGHLLQLLTVRRFQQSGHRAIAVVGGATGLIGDPKPTAERTLNDRAVVAGWVDRLRRQIEPLLDFEGPNPARIVDNLDWTAPLSTIDFLRDVGRYFRVNRMIAKEAVSVRLNSESGIGFTEFSYQVLQGMDFLELYRRYGCTLQTGGSDQWGNLTGGVDLIHRADGGEAHALATPLMTRADGTKFGKTEGGGAVWFDPELTSPYAFYQFWFNSDDRDIGSYLRAFSLRGHDEITELERQLTARPAARAPQRALAAELTTLLHGERACADVIAASQALFGRGDLAELDAGTLAAALAEIPNVAVPTAAELPTVVDLLAGAGLVSSKSDARRAISDGGAYLNNRKVTAVDAAPAATDLLHGRYLVLRRGKRTVGGVVVGST